MVDFAKCWLFVGCLLVGVVAVRRHFDQTDVVRAVQMVADGVTQREVAQRLGVSRSAINRMWIRHQETNAYIRRPGQGRRRVTTPRQDRYLVTCALRNRFVTARTLQNDLVNASGVRISDQTVRNRLHDDRMRARRPAMGVFLTRRHRRERLDFARDHQNWQEDQWSLVLFSDESRFTVSNNDGRRRVWRRQGERFSACTRVEVDSYGGGSVMVWAGVCLEGRTDLHVVPRGSITGIRYRDDVLEPIVRPFAAAVGDGFIFMQDNARPHTARVSMNFLEEEGIEVFDWPARSPDLNPIEHVWDILGRRVRGRQHPPSTVGELREALVEEWGAIPQNDIRSLIRSMPNRCMECIDAHGGHTRY